MVPVSAELCRELRIKSKYDKGINSRKLVNQSDRLTMLKSSFFNSINACAASPKDSELKLNGTQLPKITNIP